MATPRNTPAKGKSDKPKPLNANQIQVVERYLASNPRNISRAYREVYKCGERAAQASGPRLLGDARVRSMIAEREAALLAPLRLTQQRIRKEIRALSFSDIRHYRIGDDGSLQLAPDAPADAMAAVKSYKMKKRVIPQVDTKGKALPPIVEYDAEIRLWDKPTALRLGAQHRGMLVKRIGGPDGGPVLPDTIEVVVVEAKDGAPIGEPVDVPM